MMETEAKQTISIRDFLHVVFKRKALIVLFLTIAVSTVAFTSFKQKRYYQASAQILVKVGRENIQSPVFAGERSVITFDLIAEVEILGSRILAEKVAEALGPAVIYPDPLSSPSLDEAAEWLQDDLEIEAVDDSNIIEVTFEHEDPQMAAIVVNTLVDLYLERHLEIHKSPQTHEFLGEQSQMSDKRLKRAEEKLEAFKNEHNLTALEEEQSLLLRQEADLRAQLNQTLIQQAETEDRIEQLRYQLTTTPETIPLNLDNKTMEQLRAKLVEIEIQEHELLTKYSDESRLVRRIRDEIQMVRNRLGEYRSEIIQQEILRNKADLQSVKAKEEIQRAHLVDFRKKHEKLNRIEMKFNRLREKVEVHRQNYRLYLMKFEEARISDAMDRKKIANVSVIEPAKPPRRPESRGIFNKMVLATILGGIGGLGLALFSEYLEDNLDRDEDVEHHLNLPVLASIPQLER